MPTECEKTRVGELYDPLDAELVRHRERARDLCQLLNAAREADSDTAWVQPRFFSAYGLNCTVGHPGRGGFRIPATRAG